MAPNVVERSTRRSAAPRSSHGSLHPTAARVVPTVLIIDSNERRRRRHARALASVPCRLLHARPSAGAIDRAATADLAVVLIDGTDDPALAVALARRVRARHACASAILVGIESDARAVVAAVNELRAFRILPADARDADLRRAVVSGIRTEGAQRGLARLNRGWIVTLVRRIEAAMPASMLARIAERGGDLPVDLIVRPMRS